MLELPDGVAELLKLQKRAVELEPPEESEPECMVPQRTVRVTASRQDRRRGKAKPTAVEV